MQLTSFTDYSLRTLMYLAIHQERRCTVQEISGYFEISHNHMVKAVHNLAKLGYIESFKGKGGGIRLAKAPETINLGVIIKELEPDFFIAECFDCSTNYCKIAPICQLKTVLFQAYSQFIQELDKHTLASITSNRSSMIQLFDTREVLS